MLCLVLARIYMFSCCKCADAKVVSLNARTESKPHTQHSRLLGRRLHHIFPIVHFIHNGTRHVFYVLV